MLVAHRVANLEAEKHELQVAVDIAIKNNHSMLAALVEASKKHKEQAAKHEEAMAERQRVTEEEDRAIIGLYNKLTVDVTAVTANTVVLQTNLAEAIRVVAWCQAELDRVYAQVMEKNKEIATLKNASAQTAERKCWCDCHWPV